MPDDLQAIIDSKAAKKKAEKERVKLKRFEIARKAALGCFSTEDGKTFLKWLCHECGFHAASSVINPESLEINYYSTVHNEARRGVYLSIRKMLEISPEILAEVENNVKKEN